MKRFKRTNGGGDGKAPPMPAPAAAAPAPPPAEDKNAVDPAKQAEIERQRALRYKAGQIGSNTDTTGSSTDTTGSTDTTQKTTLLGA